MLYFPTPHTVLGCDGFGSGLAEVTLNKRTFAFIDCEQNHTNSYFFLDLGTNRISCRHNLSGKALIFLGTGFVWLIPWRFRVQMLSPSAEGCTGELRIQAATQHETASFHPRQCHQGWVVTVNYWQFKQFVHSAEQGACVFSCCHSVASL